MHRFFADEKRDQQLIITDRDDVKHLKKVIRLRPGDIVELVYLGSLFQARLLEITHEAVFDELNFLDELNETIEVSLIQGMPKGQKMSDILVHGTEVGIDRFIITPMDRSVAASDPGKRERYERIVKDASKQSKRYRIPKIHFEDFKKIDFACFDRVYFFYEGSDQPLTVVPKDHSIAIVMGPEGGFSDEEVAHLRRLPQVMEVSLGRRILRTETAGLVATAIIRHRLETL